MTKEQTSLISLVGFLVAAGAAAAIYVNGQQPIPEGAVGADSGWANTLNYVYLSVGGLTGLVALVKRLWPQSGAAVDKLQDLANKLKDLGLDVPNQVVPQPIEIKGDVDSWIKTVVMLTTLPLDARAFAEVEFEVNGRNVTVKIGPKSTAVSSAVAAKLV